MDSSNSVTPEMDLFYQSADIITKVKEKRGTVKTLIYASGCQTMRQMFALVNECIKYRSILDDISSQCPARFLKEPLLKGSRDVAAVLLYEQLLGRKFGRAVAFRRLLQKYKQEVKSAVESVLKKHNVSRLKDACAAIAQEHLPKIPRYMRVNLIKSSVTSAIEQFQAEEWEFIGQFKQHEFSTKALSLEPHQFGLDPYLPDLLVFPPGTDLHAHPLTHTGVLVQQDRASCIPAHALSPSPGSTVLDCCAAPGNKTSHLASLIQDSGRVVALDRDFARLSTMSRLLSTSGATCLDLVHQDFLTVQADSEDAENIRFILVDPSCSGSGMLKQEREGETDPARIQQLKRFQVTILKHALSFPNTERVVYSTCSIHREENEEVAEEVMEQVRSEFKFVKIFPEWEGSRGLDGFLHSDCFLRLDPKRDLTQGFFVACFERLSVSKDLVECSDPEVVSENGVKTSSKKKKKRKRKGEPTTDNCEEPIQKDKKQKKNSDISSVIHEESNVDTLIEDENNKETGNKAKKRKKNR